MNDEEQLDRPLAVTLLWFCCGCVIVLGFFAVSAGVVMMVEPELLDDDETTIQVIGGFLAVGGMVAMLFHCVPFFLRPSPSSWTFINTFLIVSLIVWAVTATPFIIFPLPVLAMWGREEVREYYGLGRRRRAFIDEGWNEDWDRPRR
jgi:hypothetical protein